MDRDIQRLHDATRGLIRDIKHSRFWKCEFCCTWPPGIHPPANRLLILFRTARPSRETQVQTSTWVRVDPPRMAIYVRGPSRPPPPADRGKLTKRSRTDPPRLRPRSHELLQGDGRGAQGDAQAGRPPGDAAPASAAQAGGRGVPARGGVCGLPGGREHGEGDAEVRGVQSYAVRNFS